MTLPLDQSLIGVAFCSCALAYRDWVCLGADDDGLVVAGAWWWGRMPCVLAHASVGWAGAEWGMYCTHA